MPPGTEMIMTLYLMFLPKAVNLSIFVAQSQQGETKADKVQSVVMVGKVDENEWRRSLAVCRGEDRNLT